MSSSNFQAVREFHERINVATPTEPHLPDATMMALRRTLLEEEMTELLEAMDTGDLHAIAQEAIDVLYVTYGLCVVCGIDADAIFAEIHRANISKTTGPRRADGKQLKPEGWTPPDIAGVLAQLRQR